MAGASAQASVRRARGGAPLTRESWDGDEYQRRFEPQPILFQRFVPHGVSRYNRGPGVKRDARDTGGRAGWHTEKIHEDSFFAHRVLVGKDADRAGFFQDSKHQAC